MNWVSAIGGTILFFAGLGLYIDAFERSAQLSVRDGTIRVGLSTAILGIGAVVVGLSFA